jgi:SHAQKYF class myb-like DNA-binding protein
VGDTLQRFDNKYAATSSDKKNGRWTKDEHFRFLQALKMYGKEWRKVQQHVETRTSTQARSHAQKFFVKIEKKKLSLSEFLDGLDLDNLEKDMIMSDLEDDDCDSPKNKRQLKKHEKHFAGPKQAPAKTPKATTKSLLPQSPPSLTSMSGEQDDLESQGHNLDIEEHQQDQAKAHQKALEKGGLAKPARRGRAKKSDAKSLGDTGQKPESGAGASEVNAEDKDESSPVVGTKRTHQFKDCQSNMHELQLVSEEI